MDVIQLYGVDVLLIIRLFQFEIFDPANMIKYVIKCCATV